MSNVIQPMLFFPYNYCPNCKRNTIELYSWHNYPQHYQRIIDNFEMTGEVPELNKYGIFTMRCSSCAREYNIIWRDKLPTPELGTFYSNTFMSKFKDDSIDGQPTLKERNPDD